MKAGRSERDRAWKGRMRDGKNTIREAERGKMTLKKRKEKRRDIGRRIKEQGRMREEDPGIEYLEIERRDKSEQKTREGER